MIDLKEGEVYSIRINPDDDRKWRLPDWVDEHNRYSFDKKGLYHGQFVEQPYKVKIEKITTEGIWVLLFVPEEITPRLDHMHILWKDIQTIKKEGL